ncbi:hypothetical protein M885DRAFT_612711 [Pelagophyceae sp. CCMP2097]|nr:hypothetical protein M885DRAFT_612711 [Pelagophyceae sp. CCMP2097]|mmetsp:Transcript_13705/g.48664  ORF Transcript_13705/g.48664 Transcript_13705/m.48664 type:complete len:244 (+) Transcript_13705:3-734(+)
MTRLPVALCAASAWCAAGFAPAAPRRSAAIRANGNANDETYANPLTELLGRVLPSAKAGDADDAKWIVPKRPARSLDAMVNTLRKELSAREWFVTGDVLPELFADDFYFEDPDVKLSGIRNYAEGVARLFDADSCRVEIITCTADRDFGTVDVAWRLSGRVKVGFGLNLKPYVVATELRVKDGLVTFQRDRFANPSSDILLSALAPWLPFLAPPAPPLGDAALEAQAAKLVAEVRADRRKAPP